MNKKERKKYNKNWWLKNRERILKERKVVYASLSPTTKTQLYIKSKKWYSNPKNRNRHNKLLREKHFERRLKCLNYYSNDSLQCACCGEGEIKFMCIDHINNDGAKHRKSLGKWVDMYRWLISNNFPKGFQVLCYNCNMAKCFYKTCPHKQSKLR